MKMRKLLGELYQEKKQIERAITALEALNGTGTGARKTTANQATPQPRGRRMSPAARKRMSEMMKKRWAERKRGKKGTKAAQGITAAGRKRLSAMMKARWAGRKKASAGRHMSAATRKRLSELAKQRWAERKAKTA
jgi:hypothetical protein